mmetsp:Transcript_6756/g.9823  ORF Transcript_6756/g.9823 Transcript_6756/m.9823 type:complete len:263 (+) Transcript_6756:27-815(+)|eukprot:CAMPEP_0117429366 /NCGR_PEP_ID=MMETSP0758-20121206/8929_1 /TAXON_ID=63605 /ORGANISM="Percolomonas cosmopolitus, Strain AE-1 (ATCC 50343)" /LENGTH=262 /DNA_ID=CAMNT_0005216361 /DNA_START=9 /DNA_END=797 /DNA_ORIENTATION=+
MQPDDGYFNSIQSEFIKFISDAEFKIQHLEDSSLSERKKLSAGIAHALKKAKARLNDMQLEKESPHASTRASREASYANHKKKYKSVEKVFKEESQRIAAQLRADVLGYDVDADNDDEFGSTSEDHRLQFSKNTDLLASSTKHLDDTLRVMAVSQDLLSDTAANVHDQGAKLKRMRGDVGDMQGEARSTGKILSRMTRRQLLYKLILIGIIILCLITIGLIVYFGFLAPLIAKLQNNSEGDTPSDGGDNSGSGSGSTSFSSI